MKAFLSHSSLDKPFVEQVYTRLGPAQANLDTATFEKAVLNTEAIRSALGDSELFVLFLSSTSLSSSFVSYESKLAFEALASGVIDRILIICTDQTSFASIPDFLKTLNIVTHISSPGACFRKIQAILLQLRLNYGYYKPIFVGREEEIRTLKEQLAKPSDESATVIALAGHFGIGRRTLMKKVLSEVLPTFSSFLQVSLASGAGPDDLFLELLRNRGRDNVSKLISDISSFSTLQTSERMKKITKEIDQIISENETLVINDAGGLLTEEGAYQDFIVEALQPYSNYARPIAFFIQGRMTPARFRRQHPWMLFLRIPPLSLSDTMTLTGLKLKAAGIRFDESDHRELTRIVDGHPVNVDFAVNEIKISSLSIKVFLRNTSEFVGWKDRRAFDYISGLKFTSLDTQIIASLILFRFLPTELLLEVSSPNATDAAESIQRLQDWQIVEFENDVHSISLPLRDALERSGKFSLGKEDERKLAEKVLRFIELYKDDDDISVSLIEPAIVASLRAGSGGALSQWRQLLLPSHYLRVAREAYNVRDYERATELAHQALEQTNRLSLGARIEGLRLSGLCAIRRRDELRFDAVSDSLGKIRTRHAAATKFFLVGFRKRMAGDLVVAETSYLKCFDRDEKNFAVCRELAQVYLSLGRLPEAENYARAAYKIAPTNAYVVDILVGVLIGKLMISDKKGEENREFTFFMGELEKYGHGAGKSFYCRRQAEYMLYLGKKKEARDWANRAVEMTPHLILPYYVRAKIQISRNNLDGAERDLKMMSQLSYRRGSDEGRRYSIEIFRIEFAMKLARKRYREAFNIIERLAGSIPIYIQQELERELALIVGFDQQFHDAELIAWAADHGGRTSGAMRTDDTIPLR